MKRIILFFIALTFTTVSQAATSVSGNFTVGVGQTYTSLTNNSATGFFKFLNSIDGVNTVIDGPITVTIVSDITIENGAVALNALHYDGNGPYTVSIIPDGGATRMISGFYNGNKALIDFNGAGNVVIDGRYNSAGNYLTFKNTAGGGAYATISFEGDANNITLTYCTIEGAPLNASQQFGPGYNGSNPAYIFIGNGISTGNYNITLDHNNIGSNNYIDQCIIANSTTVNNHDITISNNNIFNFMDAGYTTNDYGIYITQSGTGSGSNWKITGNSFYATGVAGGAYSQEFIYFSPGVSSAGDTISGNYLGGNLPQCAAGTLPAPGYFANSGCCSSSFVSNLVDIVNCGSIVITGNVIKNIRFTNGYASVVLVKLQGATAAVISGNEFGDNNSALRVSTTNTNANTYIKGIYNASTGTVIVDNNKFLNLWATGTSSFNSYIEPIVFTAASSNSQITNNNISGCQSVGSSSFTDNNFGINIYIPSGSMNNLLITGNVIELPSSSTTNAYYQAGILIQTLSASVSATISNNRIYDHQAANFCAVYGLYLDMTGSGAHNYTVANNQVTLTNPSGGTNVSMYGFADASCNGSGSSANYFYNSVYVGGTSSSTSNSFCFFSNPCSASAAGPALNIKNNILINARTGGTGTHYSIVNNNSMAGWSAGASDNNLLVSKGSIGKWQTGSGLTFAQWQASSGGDALSSTASWTSGASSYAGAMLNPVNLFTDLTSGDLHISVSDGQSYKFIDNLALPVVITTDYDSTARNSSTPDIGSDEFVALSTGLISTMQDPSIILYPNPAIRELHIRKGEFTLSSLAIYNVQGMKVLEEGIQNKKQEITVNISDLPAGIYFLRMQWENGSFVKSFMKQ